MTMKHNTIIGPQIVCGHIKRNQATINTISTSESMDRMSSQWALFLKVYITACINQDPKILFLNETMSEMINTSQSLQRSTKPGSKMSVSEEIYF